MLKYNRSIQACKNKPPLASRRSLVLGNKVGRFCYYINMNRGDYQYRKLKAEFFAKHEQWGGWWECAHCGRPTQYPELDHIKRTGMGGSPSRLLDVDNWQILDRDCHDAKDGGMKT